MRRCNAGKLPVRIGCKVLLPMPHQGECNIGEGLIGPGSDHHLMLRTAQGKIIHASGHWMQLQMQTTPYGQHHGSTGRFPVLGCEKAARCQEGPGLLTASKPFSAASFAFKASTRAGMPAHGP
jgi:hypothetical protein